MQHRITLCGTVPLLDMLDIAWQGQGNETVRTVDRGSIYLFDPLLLVHE